MVFLIDANVILRFLIGDHARHLQESLQIFRQIQASTMQVEILGEVLMEVLFVAIKQYNIPKAVVIDRLKSILLLKGVVNQNKHVLIEALDTMLAQKRDFVDALLCAKSNLQGYGTLSFDRDVTTKCGR